MSVCRGYELESALYSTVMYIKQNCSFTGASKTRIEGSVSMDASRIEFVGESTSAFTYILFNGKGKLGFLSANTTKISKKSNIQMESPAQTLCT